MTDSKDREQDVVDLRKALKKAITEADGWWDECRGNGLAPNLHEERALLKEMTEICPSFIVVGSTETIKTKSTLVRYDVIRDVWLIEFTDDDFKEFREYISAHDEDIEMGRNDFADLKGLLKAFQVFGSV